MGTPQLRSPHPKDTTEREKDGRSADPVLSTLDVSNPQSSPPPPYIDVPHSIRDDDTLVHVSSEGSIREEKKEYDGSWSWENPDCHCCDIRDRDGDQQDLLRVIGISSSWPDSLPPIIPDFSLPLGYLTATACEDWEVVVEVCERASANQANAKEAAKALRREIKCVSTSISYRSPLI
jgi:hypothetical protein